jgi:hypothetical protein
LRVIVAHDFDFHGASRFFCDGGAARTAIIST